MTILVGSLIILIAIAVFLYFANKPLDIMPFSRRKEPEIAPHKFKNDAPVAPDMLFELSDHQNQTVIELYDFDRTPLRKRTDDDTEIDPTPLQEYVASILYDLKRVSCTYIDELDMIVHKGEKNLGLVRCLETRLHVGHIDEVIELARVINVKSIYIVAIGQIDKPAVKLAIRKKVVLISPERLETLKRRIPLG